MAVGKALLAVALAVSILGNVLLYQGFLQTQDALATAKKELGSISELEERVSGLESSNAALSEQINKARDQNQVLQEQLAYYRNLTNFYASELQNLKSLLGNLSTPKLAAYEGNITAFAVFMMPDPSTGRIELNGTAITVMVQLIEGSGRVLVNTQPITGADFQSTARVAVDVAQKILGVSLTGYDIIFSITASFQIDEVDGPSAGAVMTVLLMSVVQGVHLRSDASMTGTITPDGSIGPVGGVLQKAEAAARAGFKTFLIPQGQNTQTVYTERVYKRGPFKIIVQEPTEIDLSGYMWRNYGVKIVEVERIEDAYRLFTG